MKKKIKTINIALVYFEYAILNIQRFEEKQYYIDITDEWVNSIFLDEGKVMEAEFFDYCNKRYFVDNKNIILDYSDEEKNIAYWLCKNFGADVYLNPRINYPDGIKTSDYIFKNEKWDLKTIYGSSNQVLYHSIYKKEEQSHNFIFDISYSTLNIAIALSQVNRIYQRHDTSFVNIIIIKDKDKFIVVKRNKKNDRTVSSQYDHLINTVYQNSMIMSNKYRKKLIKYANFYKIY